jgi:hypothetical protein
MNKDMFMTKTNKHRIENREKMYSFVLKKSRQFSSHKVIYKTQIKADFHYEINNKIQHKKTVSAAHSCLIVRSVYSMLLNLKSASQFYKYNV